MTGLISDLVRNPKTNFLKLVDLPFVIQVTIWQAKTPQEFPDIIVGPA